MGAMKRVYQEIMDAGLGRVPTIEYAVVVDGVVHDVYPEPDAARKDARFMVRNAIAVRGECAACVEVVPLMQFEPEVFAGESIGIQ